jgi:ubiquinone/menaquinone biosynthesis C-methylase UbiE
MRATLPWGAMSETTKEDVRSYWEAQPCGAKTATAALGTPEFFRQVEEWRYSVEPFIPEIARFDDAAGKEVLEVGVGLATDFVRFARAGASATGVDLTEAAVAAARERLAQEGLAGEVLVADAESLPFADESFDVVYSYGVLHHTPDPAGALREVHRVLRAGGEARIMLYSRRSWFALAVWVRHVLRRRRPWHSLTTALAQDLESPGTKAYTQAELERLFAPFAHVAYDRFVTPYDRKVAGPLANLAGRRFGWFVSITATR